MRCTSLEISSLLNGRYVASAANGRERFSEERGRGRLLTRIVMVGWWPAGRPAPHPHRVSQP